MSRPAASTTLIGDDVNIARVSSSQAFDPGTGETVVLLSAETAKELGEGFVLETVGSHLLRGQSEPIEAFHLIGAAAG
jgi:class 3 adenylate cyclase